MHSVHHRGSNARSQAASSAVQFVGVAIEIDDVLDPRLADYRGLRERGRESDEYFIVEGLTAIERLLTSQYPVRSVLLTPATHAAARRAVGRCDHLRVVGGGDVVGRRRQPAPRRCRVGDRDCRHRRSTTCCPRPRRIVMLEGINDHENLGAIARTARGLGADALLLDPTCADPFYRRSVRVSMGELLHLPIVRCATIGQRRSTKSPPPASRSGL